MTTDLASLAKREFVGGVQVPEHYIARAEPNLSRLSFGAAQQPEKSANRRPSVPTIIVDNNALTRAGLMHIISDSGFSVVAECSGLDKLPEPASASERRVVVLGLADSSDQQLSELSRWKEGHPDDLVLVLAQQFRFDEAMASLKAGASCYLTKSDISRDVLLRSLELISLGALIISSQLTGALSGSADQRDCSLAPTQTPSSSLDNMKFVDNDLDGAGLSGRERLILQHLMRGASNKHIARELGITEATVKVHVKSLLRKTRVRNRTQAAMWGISHPNRANGTDTEQRV